MIFRALLAGAARRAARIAIVVGAVALAAVVALLSWCSRPDPGTPTIVRDTADAAYWRSRAAAVEHEVERVTGEADGLRDRVAQLQTRVRGLESRAPDRIIVVDTVVVADTVVLYARLARSGVLEIATGIREPLGYRPEILSGVRLGDCDDGWLIRGQDVVCDRARLGHLTAFVRAGAAWRPDGLLSGVGSAGLRWEPSFRSATAVEIAAQADGRVSLSGQAGWRVW